MPKKEIQQFGRDSMTLPRMKCDECGEELDFIPVDEYLCADCQHEADEDAEHQRQLRADYQWEVL